MFVEGCLGFRSWGLGSRISSLWFRGLGFGRWGLGAFEE